MNQSISLSTDFNLLYSAIDSAGDFYPNVWPTLQPLIREHYYQYPVYLYSNLNDTSKLERAFKISQMLIEKKLVNTETIKDFIDLVNILVEVI